MCVAAPDVLSHIDLAAYQCCQDCDQEEATRHCPVYRCLRNQGINHEGMSHARNICAHKTCGKPLCDRHLCPTGRSNKDTRLRCCEECAKGKARCTGCGVGGIDAYSHINWKTHGKGPTDTSRSPCGRAGRAKAATITYAENAAPPTTDAPCMSGSTRAPCGL